MTSIAERVRALRDRLDAGRAKSRGEKAERARRRAEANALRLEHKRKMPDIHQ
jgi:hypothetical protein